MNKAFRNSVIALAASVSFGAISAEPAEAQSYGQSQRERTLQQGANRAFGDIINGGLRSAQQQRDYELRRERQQMDMELRQQQQRDNFALRQQQQRDNTELRAQQQQDNAASRTGAYRGGSSSSSPTYGTYSGSRRSGSAFDRMGGQEQQFRDDARPSSPLSSGPDFSKCAPVKSAGKDALACPTQDGSVQIVQLPAGVAPSVAPR